MKKKILLATTLLYGSSNLFGSAWDLTTQFEAMGQMVMKNAQDSMTQWSESTARNGFNAAADSMRSCIGDLDLGFMDALGGASIKLPCGEAWSIDNPIDDIVNSVSSDISSAVNSWVDDVVDEIIFSIDPFAKKCNRPEIRLNFGADYIDYMDREKFNEKIRDRLSIKCPNGDYVNSTDESNFVDPTDPDNISPNIVRDSGGGSHSFEIQDRMEDLKDYKKRMMREQNKKQAENCVDSTGLCTYINENGTTVEDKKFAQILTDNCDKLETESQRSECLKVKSELKSQELKDEATKKDRFLLNMRKLQMNTRIPVAFFYPAKKSGDSTVDGIFVEGWNTEKRVPNMLFSYVSIYEIVPNISNINPETGETYSTNLDTELLRENIKANGEEFSYFELLTLKDNKFNLNQEPTKKAKESWQDMIEKKVYKDKVINWNHSLAMELLVKSNDLIINQIKGLGADNPNAFLNMVQKRSLLYSQAIIVDILNKTYRDKVSSSMNDINSYSNKIEENNFTNKSEIIITLSKILSELKIQGRR